MQLTDEQKQEVRDMAADIYEAGDGINCPSRADAERFAREESITFLLTWMDEAPSLDDLSFDAYEYLEQSDG